MTVSNIVRYLGVRTITRRRRSLGAVYATRQTAARLPGSLPRHGTRVHTRAFSVVERRASLFTYRGRQRLATIYFPDSELP